MGNFNDEAYCENRPAKDVEKVAALQTLTCICEDDGEGSTDQVYGDGVNLSLDSSVAEAFEDSRLEVSERVCVFCNSEVHCDTVDLSVLAFKRLNEICLPSPNLPVFQVLESLLECDFIVRHMASISFHSCKHKSLFVRSQEVAVFWERGDKWPGDDADEDCNATLDDENPFSS